MVIVKYCPALICMQLQLLSDVFTFKYYRPLSGAILFFLCKTRNVSCWWLMHSNSPECWNSPQELFLQEQKAGSGSTVNLEPKAGASCIFQASHAHNYSPVVVRKEGLLAKWPRGDGLSVSSQKQHPASHGHGSRQTDCSRAHISSSTCVKTHLLSISQQLLCFETHYNRIRKQSRLLNGLVLLFVRRTSW